jgi:hypothetical protein
MGRQLYDCPSLMSCWVVGIPLLAHEHLHLQISHVYCVHSLVQKRVLRVHL